MKFIRINPKLIKENLAPIAPIQHLDEIDALANTLDDNLGKEVHIPKDVLDSFKIKNTLNPEIWLEGNLNPKVQKKPYQNSQWFYQRYKPTQGYNNQRYYLYR